MGWNSAVKQGRTKLLVSVRSAEEARAALAGGADIIDVKDPSRGSLGMADSAITQRIVSTVAGRVPLSVALGELCDLAVVADLAGVTWAKVGLSHAAGVSLDQDWHALARQLAPVELIGVCYADHARAKGLQFDQVFDLVMESPKNKAAQPGILIDTAIKDGKGLLAWHTIPKLKEHCIRCHHEGVFLALAGSLSPLDILQLARVVEPDIIAVRGAACECGQRDGKVNKQAVRELKKCLTATAPA